MCEQYIQSTAVDDRRHDRILHLATALSVNDFLSEVGKLVRLKVKYLVQKRQLRKYHEDAHYALALFRYEKEMAIKFRSHTTLVSMDDKHKIPVGEPGYPVACVERGKKVLCAVDKPFTVADRDFTRSLTPSVTLNSTLSYLLKVTRNQY